MPTEKKEYEDVHFWLKKEDKELIETVQGKLWKVRMKVGKPQRYGAETLRFAFDLADRYLDKKAK